MIAHEFANVTHLIACQAFTLVLEHVPERDKIIFAKIADIAQKQKISRLILSRRTRRRS